MTKSLLVLIGLSFVLIGCYPPPQFYVYKNSILKANNNDVKKMDPSELFEEFLLDGLYGFTHIGITSDGMRAENDGTMIFRDGNIRLRNYDFPDDKYLKNWKINGAFIVESPIIEKPKLKPGTEGYVQESASIIGYQRRLFFEIVIQPHWSLAPRYTLMEADILEDQTIVMSPMSIDDKKAVTADHLDLSRTTFTPFPFANEIRLFEVNNKLNNSREIISVMYKQRGFRINPLTDAQKKKIAEFAEKYKVRPLKADIVEKESCEG